MKGSRARSGNSMRIGQGIGGNNDAGGGVFEDLPLAAFGQSSAFSYFNDFVNPSDADIMAPVAIGAGGTTAIATAVENGVYKLASAVNDTGDNVQMAGVGSPNIGLCVPAAVIGTDIFGDPIKRVIGFEALVFGSNWTTTDWAVGVGSIGTGLDSVGAYVSGGFSAALLFHHKASFAGTPELLSDSGPSGPQTVPYTGPALLDATWHRFGIRIVGNDTVQFYIDGKPAAANYGLLSTDLFGILSLMTPTFSFVSDGSSGASISIDYVSIAQTRRPVGSVA